MICSRRKGPGILTLQNLLVSFPQRALLCINVHDLVDERSRTQRKVFDLEVAYRVGGFSACILVIVPILVMLQLVATVFILCPIVPTSFDVRR